MKAQQILLGIDIGATSVKGAAMAPDGTMLASHSEANAPVAQPDSPPEWRIWDLESMWQSICTCSRSVMSKVGAASIAGVAVSGFGTDGVPVSASGEILYPCISWHCGRTVSTTGKVTSQYGAEAIYERTGYHNYPINAFNRLVWLQENAPGVLDQAGAWLAVQDYIVYRLTGVFSTELTIASTMMCLDIRNRTWATSWLQQAGINPDLFSPLHESGSPVGPVTRAGSEESGIPAGTTVVTGGHDTELAILGAGVHTSDTFLDINGTWEILMAISQQCNPGKADFANGLDWECHALPGWWDCQALMIAGGVIEWAKSMLYSSQDAYDTMIDEAASVSPGANGITLLPAFVRGMGPAQAHDPLGTFLGISTQTTRADLAAATFEGLTFQFYQQVCALESSLGVKASSIRVTGGGQKNPFWMQLKADISGRSIDVLQGVESTLVGAAILAGLGSGVYFDIRDAMNRISFPVETVEPRMDIHEQYQELYHNVVSKIPPSLKDTYALIHAHQDAKP